MNKEARVVETGSSYGELFVEFHRSVSGVLCLTGETGATSPLSFRRKRLRMQRRTGGVGGGRWLCKGTDHGAECM